MMAKHKITAKKKKQRNLIAKDMHTSALYAPKVEDSQKTFSRKIKHKGLQKVEDMV